jgi:putative spermidine/putrescine transport system permease protein
VHWKSVLIVLSISPLLISAVVRTYGWLIILGDNGFIASIVRFFGAVPTPMIFNRLGMIVGMIEILMPYMILALLAGFGRLDTRLELAAASLGANRFTVVSRIVLPLALPGIMLGCMLTFVLSISAFITPRILGGGRVTLLATEIYDQAVMTLNWPVAAVLSFVSLAVFGVAVTFYTRLVRHLGAA